MSGSKKWRIIFMGTPAFSVPILKALIDSEDEIVAVVTQPDRPKGRGQKISFSPVKKLALEFNIPIFQPEKIKESTFIKQLRSLKPELIVVAAYGQILPKEILNIPTYGCLNVHASLLPKYRGAAPINWAIVCGEKETGITIMLMDEGLDTGDILLMESISIGEEETAGELHDRLALLGAKLIIKAIDGLKKGLLIPQKQPEEGVSYAPMIKKKDGLADFKKSALELANLIRGFDPWPSVYTYYEGKLLRLFRPKVILDTPLEPPGTIIKADKEGILIATGQGSLLIREVQFEGGKRMPVKTFLLGHNIKPGTKFKSET